MLYDPCDGGSLIAIAFPAQNNAFNGFCVTQGGKSAVVSGLSSSNKLDGIIPSCTVQVFLTGTTTPVPSIFKDALGTPLSNPFTADSLSAAAPGKWLFYAPDGIGYDVVMSGGIPPLTYLLPVTLTDLRNGGGGGGTGVTSVSCDPAMGNLLGCNVTNPGTTPGLHWSLNTQAAQTVYGNFTGSTRGPFFALYSCTGLLTCNFDTPSNTWTLNVPTAASLSITTTDCIKVNGGNGPVSSGTANISESGCTAAPAIQMQNTAAPAGNGIFVPFTAGNATLIDPCNLVTKNVDAKSGAITSSAGSLVCHNATATLTWSLPVLPTGVSAGDVTGVYVLSNNWSAASSPGPTSFSCSGSGTIPVSIPPDVQVLAGPLSGITGSNIGTVSCSISYSQSTAGSFIVAQQTQIGLWVTLSTTPPPQTAILNIGDGLEYLSVSNLLKVRPFFPNLIYPVTRVPDPSPAMSFGQGYPISFVYGLLSNVDGAACVGGGTSYGFCITDGSGWKVWVDGGGGGGGGTYFTEVVTCASTCALTHTPAVFDNLSINGLVMINGTDFTQSGTTITLTVPAVGGDVYYAQYHY